MLHNRIITPAWYNTKQMAQVKNQHWPQKFINYIASIDKIWLLIWSTIFISFVLLDSFFQSFYPLRNVSYHLTIGSHIVALPIIQNGTFLGVTLLKYSGILLSYFYARKKFPKDYTLHIALLFTLLADTILTFDSISIFGVLVFCLAQYFHIARFAKVRPKFFISWTFFMLLLLIFGWFNQIPDMYVLAFIYATSLLQNLILTHRWWKESKSNPAASDREIVASTCAFAGFILFILCDLNVAVSYLSVTAVLPIALARYANFFAWLFYYPSQVLISNSSTSKIQKPKNSKKVENSKETML